MQCVMDMGLLRLSISLSLPPTKEYQSGLAIETHAGTKGVSWLEVPTTHAGTKGVSWLEVPSTQADAAPDKHYWSGLTIKPQGNCERSVFVGD